MGFFFKRVRILVIGLIINDSWKEFIGSKFDYLVGCGEIVLGVIVELFLLMYVNLSERFLDRCRWGVFVNLLSKFYSVGFYFYDFIWGREGNRSL